MTVQETIQRGYMVSVRQVPDTADTYQLAYERRGIQQARNSGGAPKRVPEGFKASARVLDNEIQVTWQKTPPDSAAKEEFEEDVRHRVGLLHQWIERLSPLLSSVKTWAEELGWATRIISKPLKDAEIGDYKAPALLLQQDMVRAGLEPIGRSAPGVEGVVDLYLLPVYDDIASFFHYDGKWHLHWQPPAETASVSVREAQAKPFNKKSLREVLDEMKKHGG